jgi:DNA-binding NtrC family response regulator
MNPQQTWTHGLTGQSPKIDSIRQFIAKAARNQLPVLLTGESGTGKEVVARAIHNANPRGQFVTIDCTSLVGTLVESELFGHLKGSFTSATEQKKGLIEIADNGTLFLDEIGELPLEMQVKLLRVIQEGEFRAVGSTAWRKVDLRIIAATNRDLKLEVASGNFRKDLYYRLNVFSIRLPPLRDRKEDLPPLIEHFLSLGQAAGQPRFQPCEEVMQTLLNYNWPGNVRELKHCVERLMALNSEGSKQMLDLSSPCLNYANNSLQHLSDALQPQIPLTDKSAAAEKPIVSTHEHELLEMARALRLADGHPGEAAKMLKMSRTTFYRRMKQYNL